MLLSQGARVEARDQGYTPLLAAAEFGHTEVQKVREEMSDRKAESDLKMASTKTTSDPKGVLAIQSTASLVSLSIYAGIMILHAMVVQPGLAYAGLVLPHHVNSTSP